MRCEEGRPIKADERREGREDVGELQIEAIEAVSPTKEVQRNVEAQVQNTGPWGKRGPASSTGEAHQETEWSGDGEKPQGWKDKEDGMPEYDSLLPRAATGGFRLEVMEADGEG
jgi:hypothetical protein